VETDYLVIGGGAAGLAFADTLVTESEADVIIVDRRAAPGGHWNDAYPFVRLHQPSRYYGVNSMPIDSDDIQSSGPEAGWYQRASGADIRAYYQQVMRRLVASGRVRFFPQCDYAGEQSFVSRISGETFDVAVRRRVVDAKFLGPAIPATTPPPFEVSGPEVIPVNQLPEFSGSVGRFVVIGAGKTAMDACIWLLGNGVEPARIQWIKPRDAWLFNRRDIQPGELVGTLFESFVRQIEASARATSIDDLFDRLEVTGEMLRIDPQLRPTMYRFAIVGAWEVELLRRITDVVRLGRVRRIDQDQVVLDKGTIRSRPGDVYIHCAADGLRSPPPQPMFSPGRITLQTIRIGLAPFAASVVAFVEAHRDADAEKNRLCPPNVYPNEPVDFARGTLVQMRADRAWSMEPDIASWLDRARLNPMHGLRARMVDPAVQRAAQRYAEHAGAAVARLTQLTM
jgi:hypothetical protein